jgi:hypothetical protein
VESAAENSIKSFYNLSMSSLIIKHADIKIKAKQYDNKKGNILRGKKAVLEF